MTDRPLPPEPRLAVAPTPDQFASIQHLDPDRAVVMLNLLRYRDEADYSDFPGLAPTSPITGEEAYRRYGEAAWPHIQTAGASISYLGSCESTIIGPPDEHWDSIILVRYPNPGAFVAMAMDPDYQQAAGHRTAALADSRLIATSE